MKMNHKTLILTMGMASFVGCAAPRQPVVLYTMDGGHQRVWPQMVDQPTVIAFWDTETLESINALQSLNTLAYRQGFIHLTSVCTSRDLAEINKWRRREGVIFEVMHDPDAKLARRLRVNSYPTFIFFDKRGKEIGRSLEIRTINNWFDRDRWLRRADREGYREEVAIRKAREREEKAAAKLEAKAAKEREAEAQQAAASTEE